MLRIEKSRKNPWEEYLPTWISVSSLHIPLNVFLWKSLYWPLALKIHRTGWTICISSPFAHFPPTAQFPTISLLMPPQNATYPCQVQQWHPSHKLWINSISLLSGPLNSIWWCCIFSPPWSSAFLSFLWPYMPLFSSYLSIHSSIFFTSTSFSAHPSNVVGCQPVL